MTSTPADTSTNRDASPREVEENEYEVIVGFSGSSRTAVEVVTARIRGDAGRKATSQHGCTAVVSEVFEL